MLQKILSISLLWLTIGYTAWFVISAWWLRLILLGIAVGVTTHLVSINTLRPETPPSSLFTKSNTSKELD